MDRDRPVTSHSEFSAISTASSYVGGGCPSPVSWAIAGQASTNEIVELLPGRRFRVPVRSVQLEERKGMDEAFEVGGECSLVLARAGEMIHLME